MEVGTLPSSYRKMRVRFAQVSFADIFSPYFTLNGFMRLRILYTNFFLNSLYDI